MEQAVVNAGMISMVAFPRVRSRGSGGNDFQEGRRFRSNPTRPIHPRAVRLCMIYIYGVEDCLGIPDLGETS